MITLTLIPVLMLIPSYQNPNPLLCINTFISENMLSLLDNINTNINDDDDERENWTYKSIKQSLSAGIIIIIDIIIGIVIIIIITNRGH